MSSSETDDTINELDDSDDDMSDSEYDHLPDHDDTSRLASFFNSLSVVEKFDVFTVHSADNYSLNAVRSAFGVSSHATFKRTVSRSIFDDSIRSYVEAPPLFQSTANLSPYYLSIDPTIHQSNSNPLASDKLFVANISYTGNARELKEFFLSLGYNVQNVDLPNNHKQRGHSGFAFIQFSSEDISEDVLYQFAKSPQEFIFKGRQLRIDRCRKSRQQMKETVTDRLLDDGTPSIVTFDIANIHYGTFIMGTAMNNITGTDSADEFGFIAHRLVHDERSVHIRFRIDQKDKKFSIVVSYESLRMPGVSTDLAFEWTFGNLKGEKISPISVNGSYISLLVELKRPPVILRTDFYDLHDEKYDTRLPGTPLIGRANAWLFQLSRKKFPNDYIELFRILRRYNLSPQRFFEHHIPHLIHPITTARQNLRHVQVLSNDKWIQENRDLVDRFLEHRWPEYPFETKFELMKLLSKHIITINDLIIDEQFDKILATCSLNTFIACTAKIIEFAPRWLHETCDNEDEDWGEEEQSEIIDDQSTTDGVIENISSDDHNSSPVFIRSAMGTSIDATNTIPVFPTDNIGRLNIQAQKNQMGYLSHFLMKALCKLRNKHELCRTTDTKYCVTKHEFRKVHSNSSLIRKVYITPSTILYEGPYQEEKCLVTRHFAKEQDGFLRVTFRDEDYRKLQNTGVNLSRLYERIKTILINGIGICDRYYDFLAFSSSQLREHCCWMFSSMNNVSVDTIRNWMGDFRNIHPVAKMAARLGQSFSTTKKGLELESRKYREISDVKSGKLCLTDGIGIIALWFAKELCKELSIDDEFYRPCAFQIRFGGYKGMVCLDVASQISNPDVGLHLRPSMNKFDSTNQSVDIVRVSSIPSAGFLNRQIILLLSSLGIKDEIFLTMQDQMLQDLSTLTTDHEKAREFIKQFGGSGGNGYLTFLSEYLKRFRQQIDPFARKILIAFQTFLVKELRTKARIVVPDTWSLFGVIDETRTLRYGEVFIQTEQRDESGNLNSKIITGSVIATRNPCFHPDDIRRLTAIDVPALHQLKNVIVFPMDSRGSHPAEMSGGDLDGDTFWVSQDPKLLFEEYEAPFDYHDQAMEDAEQMEHDTNTVYNISDVCKFFVKYIEADNLGVIANSHLAFADQSPLGPKANECLKLARMHSTAVDFAKTGASVPPLTSDLRPKKYPHFMENKYKTSYHSETILGQLYDEVKQFEKNFKTDNNQTTMNTCSFPYEILIVDGSDAYMSAAKGTKNNYELELTRVMRQYGIQSEAELVSGYILKFTTKQYAKQAKTFDLRNEISHAVKIIQDKYLHIFYEELYHQAMDKQELIDDEAWSSASKKLTWKKQFHWFESYHENEITNNSEIIKKASAWFRVTYQWLINQTKPSKKNKKRNRKRKNRMVNKQKGNREWQDQSKRPPLLLSFAWIVYPVLMKIYDIKQSSNE